MLLMDGIKMDSRQKWKRSKRMNKEMGSNSNNNKDSSEAHRVLVLQGGGALGAYEAGVYDVLYF